MECLRLRVKELEFARMQIEVRDTKGKRDRFTILPRAVIESLREHLVLVRRMHELAMQQGYGGVELPFALYMSLRNMKTVAEKFRAYYPPDLPIAVVYSAGYADKEKVLRSTLATIEADISQRDEKWLGLVRAGIKFA